MKKFNIICNWSGMVYKIIFAQNLTEAISICNAKGYDIQDDYFLESIEETAIRDAKVGRVIYNDEER